MTATLFAHYPASPGSVQAVASRIQGSTAAFGSVGTSVNGRVQQAGTTVQGSLTAPLSTAGQPVQRSSTELARAALVADGTEVTIDGEAW